MKKTRLRLKRKVKIYLANALNMSIGLIALLTMLLSKSITVPGFKFCVLVVLLTMMIEDLIPDIKKDL